MEETIQPIDPIAIAFGPLQVHWYGVIIGLAIILALYIAIRETEKRGLDKDVFMDLMLWAIPIAILSARLYYVIFEWNYYSQNPGEIIAIWNGGLAIHGALIGGVITAIVFTKKKTSFLLAVSRYCGPKYYFRASDWKMGEFYQSRSTWWRSYTCFP